VLRRLCLHCSVSYPCGGELQPTWTCCPDPYTLCIQRMLLSFCI
jgi:hypothetical protein